MWISKKQFAELTAERAELHWESREHDRQMITLREKNAGLERLNSRLQSDLDWFKHRLTQVERERAMLVYAATGQKVAAPEFVPTYKPDEALNEAHNPFTGVGDDSLDPADKVPEQEDFSHLPGYMKS